MNTIEIIGFVITEIFSGLYQTFKFKISNNKKINISFDTILHTFMLDVNENLYNEVLDWIDARMQD